MEAFNTAHALWMCLDTNQLISIIHDSHRVPAVPPPKHTLTVSAYHSLYTEYAGVHGKHTHTKTQTDHCLRQLCAEKHAVFQVD